MIKKLSTASKSKLPVILLFGPTAVGKTALVEQLFSTDFEIINADSMQVYRYMDIGTAKPSPKLRKLIPHHLIDIRTPDQQYDVGQFVRDADRAAAEISARGRIPLITGGTAFYFYHFLYGLPPAPPSDKAIRETLYRRLSDKGHQSLWTELQRHDPVSAEKLHPNDTQRLIRALEVFYSTGQPLSAFNSAPALRSGYEYLVLGLQRERAELYERINRRVDQMWTEGLADEFQTLLSRGYTANDPGMRGIGYREFCEMQSVGELLYEDIKAEIKKNSRRYAKRQITFFKRISETEWFAPADRAKITVRVQQFLQR